MVVLGLWGCRAELACMHAWLVGMEMDDEDGVEAHCHGSGGLGGLGDWIGGAGRYRGLSYSQDGVAVSKSEGISEVHEGRGMGKDMSDNGSMVVFSEGT